MHGNRAPRSARFPILLLACLTAAVLATPPAAGAAIAPAFTTSAERIPATGPAFGPIVDPFLTSADAASSRPGGSLRAGGSRAATAFVTLKGVRYPTIGAVPPDATGAIGRGHYVEHVNGEVSVYERRTLRLVSRLNSNEFWHIAPYPTIDPQIAWDDGSQRWYAATMDKARDRLLFGWSKTADPRDLRHGWCQFRAPRERFFPDFPMLGFSRTHLVIGANMADADAHRVVFSRIWAIGKPASRAAGCRRPPISAFGTQQQPLRQADGRPSGTPVPARQVRPSGTAWVFATDCPQGGEPASGEEGCEHADPSVNQITEWAVQGPRSAPRLIESGGITVDAFAEPSPAPQPRTRARIDASDTRLTLAIMNRDPSMGGADAAWVSHAVAGPNGQAVIRWYEIDPSRLAVLRQGTVRRGRDWAMYPAVSPTSRGNSAVLHYVVAGPRLLPQIRARHRGRGDPPGTMRRDVALASSAAGLSKLQCERNLCRYGDYAGASPDPLRPDLVWGTNELMGRPVRNHRPWPNWETLNFAVPSPPATGR
jgi:hypothetical protein